MGRGEHFVVMFVGAPLWVKSRHRRSADKCPLSPQKRTLELSRGMSALCQKRTLCGAAKFRLFDQLVGGVVSATGLRIAAKVAKLLLTTA